MYYGYCLKEPLGWMPPAQLETAEACMTYCLLHHRVFEEVRITDDEDYVVMHVKDSKYLYPRETEGVDPEALANIDRLFAHSTEAT